MRGFWQELRGDRKAGAGAEASSVARRDGTGARATQLCAGCMCYWATLIRRKNFPLPGQLMRLRGDGRSLGAIQKKKWKPRGEKCLSGTRKEGNFDFKKPLRVLEPCWHQKIPAPPPGSLRAGGCYAKNRTESESFRLSSATPPAPVQFRGRLPICKSVLNISFADLVDSALVNLTLQDAKMVIATIGSNPSIASRRPPQSR